MVGSILGDAFDRAIGLTLRHWRIVLVFWIVLGAAYCFDPTPNQVIVLLLSMVPGPVCAIWAARSLSSDFKVGSAPILRYFVCSALLSIATLVLSAILAAIFIPNLLHARSEGGTSIWPVIGLVLTVVSSLGFIFWIGNKWSLAPIIAFYGGRPVAISFGQSWAITTGAFWQTLMFNVAAGLAFIAVWFVPIFVGWVISSIAYHHDPSKISVAIRDTPALFVPLLIYALIAEVIAYIRWLDRLDALHGAANVEAASA